MGYGKNNTPIQTASINITGADMVLNEPYIKLYKHENQEFVYIKGKVHRIDRGSFNTLVEAIGCMSHELAAEYIYDKWLEGKIKKFSDSKWSTDKWEG